MAISRAGTTGGGRPPDRSGGAALTATGPTEEEATVGGGSPEMGKAAGSNPDRRGMAAAEKQSPGGLSRTRADGELVQEERITMNRGFNGEGGSGSGDEEDGLVLEEGNHEISGEEGPGSGEQERRRVVVTGTAMNRNGRDVDKESGGGKKTLGNGGRHGGPVPTERVGDVHDALHNGRTLLLHQETMVEKEGSTCHQAGLEKEGDGHGLVGGQHQGVGAVLGSLPDVGVS